MNDILVGNICALAAMVSDSVSGTRKKRNEILGIQLLSQFFYAAGSIVLKGYSSTAQNVVAVFNFMIMNYVGTFACIVVIVTTSVALWKSRKKNGAADPEV